MNDTFDELRIIAKDGGRLDPTDRAVIARGADELETVYRLLISTQAALIEAQQRQIATNERLIELTRRGMPVVTAPVPLKLVKSRNVWRIKLEFPPCL
jgi:hypothetical protein